VETDFANAGGSMAENRQEGTFEQLGQAVGGAAGKMAGRAHDAALNAFGSLFGAALQQMGEWWASPEAERAASSFGDAEDRACRQHWESRSGSGTSASGTSASDDYERARSRYQFGHVAAHSPEYQGKTFDEIEARIQKAWETVGRDRGEWSEVRDQVGFGYTHRTPGAPNPS
jgi:hypothetical protein